MFRPSEYYGRVINRQFCKELGVFNPKPLAVQQRRTGTPLKAEAVADTQPPPNRPAQHSICPLNKPDGRIRHLKHKLYHRKPT
ncbi:hypothetical protein AKG43_02190 [Neisseria sp. 74A18]|nr:hypothetical protein AKG43_02190 [Neisseria sp. 74A18]